MVKKLFKQEMLYYVRSLAPVYIILLGVSLVGRVVQFFESDSWVYSTVSGSALTAYVIACIAALGLATAFCVIRYYKNMFSGEGYLTLTLPVTYTQHLWVKLGAAMLTMVATLVAVAVSLLIFLNTEWLVELWKAAVYLSRDLVERAGAHLIFYLLEGILLLLALLVMEILTYYMCISLGQTVKKNRILAAIGIYYGFYLVTQILSTVFMIVTTFSVSALPMEEIERWIRAHVLEVIHGGLLSGTVLAVVVSMVMFLVSRWVLRKRLNLE